MSYRPREESRGFRGRGEGEGEGGGGEEEEVAEVVQVVAMAAEENVTA